MLSKTTFKNGLGKFSFLQEVLILLLFIFLINGVLGKKPVVIVADGKGYYDYLPALFIYHDLNFNYTDTLVTEYYNHKAYNQGINPEVNGRKINKYFIGTAISQIPFFLLAHGIAKVSKKYDADGYGPIYQDFVTYAAFFYLMLGLIFLRKLLRLKGVPNCWVFVLQLFVLFASSLMQYGYFDASFSHVYSFFFITFFIYCVSEYASNPRNKFLYLASFSLGLILLIRPANGLILLFVPFLFRDYKHFVIELQTLFTKKYKTIFLSILLLLCILAIQPLVWYLQTGLFFVKPYQDETFILSQPNFLKFLFSYQKGFFVYAPVFLLLMIAGVLVHLKQRNFWKTGSFLFAFVLLVYVLSSWWNWYYGASYGSRVMVDYYSLFVFFAHPVFLLKRKIYAGLFTLLLVPLSYASIVQTYQYQNYILDYGNMNKQKFYQVFLKTHPKYMGLFFQQHYKMDEGRLVLQKHRNFKGLAEPLVMGYNLVDSIYGNSLFERFNPGETAVFELNFDVSYNNGIDELILTVDDASGTNRYYHKQHLFKGATKENFCGIAQLQFRLDPNLFEDATINILFRKKEESTDIKEVDIKLAAF